MKDQGNEAGGSQGVLAKTLSILTFCTNAQVYGLPVTAVNQADRNGGHNANP
jgi:hypothetical protein